MAIFDLFSKRQKKLRAEVPDVYTYDNIPEPLRVQVVHIWWEALGNINEYNERYVNNGVFDIYKGIVDALCREYGVFELPHEKQVYGDRHYLSELVNFVLQEQNTERVFDAIELSFRCIDKIARHLRKRNCDTSKRADEAIAELNARFQEHGVGYQFIDGEIIRVDSELIHAEVIKPALALLHGAEYAGAQAEFLKAHEHYRHGNAKEALNECLKALESTMKAICNKRGLSYDPAKASCSTLIGICFANNLIPKFWENHFSALRTTLESGVPTGRNKLSGHGQGSAVVDVPMHLVAYVLHMTAAAIVFLVNSEVSLS